MQATIVFLLLAAAGIAIGSSKTVTECENKTLQISCPAETTIRVLSANYGRSDLTICPGKGTDVNCAAAESTNIVTSSCEGQETCTVDANNSVFGDPCKSTFKYLEVTYECLGEPQTVTACEHETLQVSCPAETTIEVLSANYGRSDLTTCPGAGSDTNCAAAESTNIVTSSCDELASCSVLAENSVFGDPCVNTFKYLSVTYQCRG